MLPFVANQYHLAENILSYADREKGLRYPITCE